MTEVPRGDRVPRLGLVYLLGLGCRAGMPSLHFACIWVNLAFEKWGDGKKFLSP